MQRRGGREGEKERGGEREATANVSELTTATQRKNGCLVTDRATVNDSPTVFDLREH